MDDYYIGEIALFPYGYIPYGWLRCDGSYLDIKSNQALYSLIGSKFGLSADKTKFAIPDLQNAEPFPALKTDKGIIYSISYCIHLYGVYPMRAEQ